MIRRQYVLIVLFTVVFQFFFASTNTPSNSKSHEFGSSNTTNKCEPASIDEFPSLFFTDEQCRRGGFLVYIALILYSFAAIEIVCDDYFASALERISCNFNLTPVRRREMIVKEMGFFLSSSKGCCRSDFYGIGNISIGIFYIHCRSFLC